MKSFEWGGTLDESLIWLLIRNHCFHDSVTTVKLTRNLVLTESLVPFLPTSKYAPNKLRERVIYLLDFISLSVKRIEAFMSVIITSKDLLSKRVEKSWSLFRMCRFIIKHMSSRCVMSWKMYLTCHKISSN